MTNFSIQGNVQVSDNETTQEICDRLESSDTDELSIDVQTVDVAGDDGKFSHTVLVVNIDGSEVMSYTSVENFINTLQELSPFATEVGVFETDTDGDKETVWIGKEDAVADAQLKEKVRVAREAIEALPADEREKLIKLCFLDK